MALNSGHDFHERGANTAAVTCGGSDCVIPAKAGIHLHVIPAKAGIQIFSADLFTPPSWVRILRYLEPLDSRLRGNDGIKE